MTVAELVEMLEPYRDDVRVVIEGRVEGPNDITQVHDVQKAIGVDGAEEIHLIAADGIRDR